MAGILRVQEILQSKSSREEPRGRPSPKAVVLIKKPTKARFENDPKPTKLKARAFPNSVLRATQNSAELWEEGAQALQRNLEATLAPSTAKQYNRWWQKFKDFTGGVEGSESTLTGESVAVFLSYTAETASVLGGVEMARAALKHNFKLRNIWPNPADADEVDLAIRGMKRRFQKPVEKKAALEKEDFYKLILKATNGGRWNEVKLCQLRLAAQISLMFCTFSRYEEAAALKLNQVYKEGGNLTVKFEKGKNYQWGQARVSVVSTHPNGPVNPVEVIDVYMNKVKQLKNNSKGFLFPALRSSPSQVSSLDKPASYNAVAAQFKLLLLEAKVTADPADFGLHSMRRGGVSAAVNAGVSEHAVQKQMRVASTSTVRRYATLNKAMLATTSAAVFK